MVHVLRVDQGAGEPVDEKVEPRSDGYFHTISASMMQIKQPSRPVAPFQLLRPHAAFLAVTVPFLALREFFQSFITASMAIYKCFVSL